MTAVESFAALSGGELISVLTIMSGMLVGFFGVSKMMLNQASKDREKDREERKALVSAINTMAKSNQSIAEETKKGNREAKIRNGHLGEQNIQIAELVKSTKEDMLKAVQNVKIQHVDHQTVNEEIVKSRKVR